MEQQKSNPVADAMKVITAALNEDKLPGSYYYSWEANIAMAFKDEYDRQLEGAVVISDGTDPHSLLNIHEIANNAAKNFLDLLCSQPND